MDENLFDNICENFTIDLFQSLNFTPSLVPSVPKMGTEKKNCKKIIITSFELNGVWHWCFLGWNDVIFILSTKNKKSGTNGLIETTITK